jgi:hypothetical protein
MARIKQSSGADHFKEPEANHQDRQDNTILFIHGSGRTFSLDTYWFALRTCAIDGFLGSDYRRELLDDYYKIEEAQAIIFLTIQREPKAPTLFVHLIPSFQHCKRHASEILVYAKLAHQTKKGGG